ncbi:hypothetical protein CBL_21005 [Carabus blaptoides fortunei]
MQPLDASCFSPFKSYYHKGIDDWMLNHPGTPMTIYHIAGVVDSDFVTSYVTDRSEILKDNQDDNAMATRDKNNLRKNEEEIRCSTPASGSSKANIVTPQDIRPHLKAEERKPTLKGRKKAQSTILTDSPVKKDFEKNMKKEYNDDSQEVCDDSSDVESDMEDFQYDSDINIEDFVVAKYATKKSLKHSVGQVKALNNDEFT